MSIFSSFVRWVGRQVGAVKDPPTPAPIAGGRSVLVPVGGDLAEEAAALIRGHVPPAWQPPLTVYVRACSYEELRSVRQRRGTPGDLPAGHRDGWMFPPKAGHEGTEGVYLVRRGFDKETRRRLALHEWGHVAWHYLLTAEEWGQWAAGYGDPEGFADACADYWLGKSMDGRQRQWLDHLAGRLAARGSAVQRN